MEVISYDGLLPHHAARLIYQERQKAEPSAAVLGDLLEYLLDLVGPEEAGELIGKAENEPPDEAIAA